jgi:plastocyanin
MRSFRSSLVLVPFFILACSAPAGGPSPAELAATTIHAGANDGTADAGNGDASPSVFVATIKGFTFPKISVPVGTTVRWVNSSRAPHTVTSGKSSDDADAPGALFDATIRPGESFEFTFTQVGEQPYFCRFHEDAGMVGTVVVTE